MKRNFKRNLLIGLFIGIIFFLGFGSRDLFNKTKTSASQDETKNILLPEPKSGVYKVIRVLDGDTIVISTGEKVRYLGVDAPEVNVRWGPEAKEFNEEKVLDKKVWIELDRTKLDKYGRILAYVWIDGEMVNELLLEEGYGKINLIKGDAKLKYLDRLEKAETWAHEHHHGVWLDDWIAL
jgi:micrococcal nuclease